MKKASKGIFGYLLMIGAFIALIVVLSDGLGSTDNKKINYPKLLEYVEADQVDRVSIRGTKLYGRLRDSKISVTDYPSRYDFETTIGSDFYDTMIKIAIIQNPEKDPDTVGIHDLKFTVDYLEPLTTPWYVEMLPYFITIGGVILIWVFVMRSQGGARGAMNFGRVRNGMVDPSRNKIRFTDVAGAEEEKEELCEVVDFLKNPKNYTALGAKIPKGVLLVGPPGTGKTLLAKAVAGEAGVPFFSISGSDFVEMFVGVGASRVRDLFEQAKRYAPSIVFIDEIDAVGRHRGAGLGGGHDEREQTLNQLLVEMDGFSDNEGVIVMAATNRRDILDPALLRPGRFDRQITVNYPDLEGRSAILKVHAKNKPLEADVDLELLAKRTPYATGADLANIMNEGAILAARAKESKISMDNLVEAVERIQMGPEKKSHKVLEEDRRITAYHEAGHAIVGHFLPLCDDVHQITIVPRGMAAGMTMLLPEKEFDHEGKQKLLQMIAMMLAGRAAEELTQRDICTGALSDLQRATEVARGMVTKYGMSEKLGTVYLANDQEVFVGMEFGQSREYSEQTACIIDEEVRSILTNAYEQAKQILRDHMQQLIGLAELLMQKESIKREEFLDFIAPAADEPEVTLDKADGVFE